MEFKLNIFKKPVAKKPSLNAELDRQQCFIKEALDRANRRERQSDIHACGRLIFAIDLTESRETSLVQARIAIEAMFNAITVIGRVKMMLAWYRGENECKKSQWYDNPSALAPSMQKLLCKFGRTQIARLMRMAMAEGDAISGMVFVGDHCEEDSKILFALAEALGKLSIPLFIFQECKDEEYPTLRAKEMFKQMADLSGGIYLEFKPDNCMVLPEALTSVAAFSLAGSEGVRQIGSPKTPEALQLHGRLLIGNGR